MVPRCTALCGFEIDSKVHILMVEENALDIISQGLLKDQESDLLDKECDTPFYDKSENLTSLIAEYARKNRDSLLS